MSDLCIAWSPSSFCAVDDAPLRVLHGVGARVVGNPYGRRLTEAEITAHIKDADGLIAGLEPLQRSVLTAAPKLRAIARVGIGLDNVDLDAAHELGIRISNTPDAPAESVAELTVAAALALVRGLCADNRAVHEGSWEKAVRPGLKGSEVLLVGYGRIGRAVGRALTALGAHVLVTDPALGNESTPGIRPVTLDEGLRRALVVSLHADGRDCIIRSRELALMREGSVLLNSARGELVDEQALVNALRSGRLAGAWFDVFWREPYTGPLTEFDQVLLTPHVGTYTEGCRRDMELRATINLLRDLGVSHDASP